MSLARQPGQWHGFKHSTICIPFSVQGQQGQLGRDYYLIDPLSRLSRNTHACKNVYPLHHLDGWRNILQEIQELIIQESQVLKDTRVATSWLWCLNWGLIFWNKFFKYSSQHWSPDGKLKHLDSVPDWDWWTHRHPSCRKGCVLLRVHPR